MNGNMLSKFTKAGLAVALLALVFCARPAAATPVTYNFTGTAQCVGGSGSGGACGSIASGGTATITGTFQFDDSTETIGNFSFSLPNGISISGTGTGSLLEEMGTSDQLLFCENNCGSSGVVFALDFSDPADSGALLIGVQSGGGVSRFQESFGTFDFISGTATVPGPTGTTPEPGSLLLLGTGLVGLGPMLRRRFAQAASNSR
jgi:hypothetical protein